MAENDFLAWAIGTGANVYDQATYAAMAALQVGIGDGIADPILANTTWRKGTVMADMLGQFINAAGLDALDNSNIAQLLANYEAALIDYIVTTLFQGQPRLRLAANATLWVSPTGNDLNTGLSLGTALATPQRAASIIQNNYDLNGLNIAVRIQPGTYAGGLQLNGAVVGAASPTSVQFQAIDGAVNINGAGYCFVGQQGSMFSLAGNGFNLNCSLSGGAGWNVAANGGARVIVLGNLTHSNAAIAHLFAAAGGQLTMNSGSSETISGNAQAHAYAHANGIVQITGVSSLISGAPAFSSAFAFSDESGTLEAISYSYTGTGATGPRALANTNGVINTNGGGAGYFPGNSTIAPTSGGQIV